MEKDKSEEETGAPEGDFPAQAGKADKGNALKLAQHFQWVVCIVFVLISLNVWYIKGNIYGD